MIPGVLAFEAEVHGDRVELVGENLYCVLMYLRSTMRPRPTIEALADRLLREAVRTAAAAPSGTQLALFGWAHRLPTIRARARRVMQRRRRVVAPAGPLLFAEAA